MADVVDKSLFATGKRSRAGARARAMPRLLNGQALAEAQRLSRPAVRPGIFAALLQCLDLLALFGAGLIAGLAAPDTFAAGPGLLVVWLAAILVVVAMRLMGAYRFRRMRRLANMLVLLWCGMSLGFAALCGLIWLAEPPGAGELRWVGLWAALASGPMVLARLLVWARIRFLTKTGQMEHRIVVIGSGNDLAPLIREIDRERRKGRRLCGFFDERRDTRSPDVIEGHHKMGNVDDLIAFGRLAHIDTVIVAIPRISHRRLMELLTQILVLPVDIRVMADAELPDFARRRRSRIGRFRMVNFYSRPIHGGDALVKRAFDLVFASLAALVFAPVMVLVALAIRLESPGPVLFRQKRHGFNNRPIEVFKFRSMYADRCDPSAVRAVRRGDDRVTRLGRFLRRSSLDELPQIYNVLRGDLSLVGPRPHATAARTGDLVYDAVAEAYSARHKVKPGVTGWAQINGWRGEMNTPEKIRARVEHDLHYVENWSLWLDLKILVFTPISLITTKNAY
ncbi:MAG: undecaprenyl-phosphate glucose phosphotransferase [Pararhodobacter sp.]